MSPSPASGRAFWPCRLVLACFIGCLNVQVLAFMIRNPCDDSIINSQRQKAFENPIASYFLEDTQPFALFNLADLSQCAGRIRNDQTFSKFNDSGSLQSVGWVDCNSTDKLIFRFSNPSLKHFPAEQKLGCWNETTPATILPNVEDVRDYAGQVSRLKLLNGENRFYTYLAESFVTGFLIGVSNPYRAGSSDYRVLGRSDQCASLLSMGFSNGTANGVRSTGTVGCFKDVGLLPTKLTTDQSYRDVFGSSGACASAARSFRVYGLKTGADGSIECWAGNDIVSVMQSSPATDCFYRSEYVSYFHFEFYMGSTTSLFVNVAQATQHPYPPPLANQVFPAPFAAAGMVNNQVESKHDDRRNVYYTLEVNGTGEQVVAAAYRSITQTRTRIGTTSNYTINRVVDASKTRFKLLLVSPSQRASRTWGQLQVPNVASWTPQQKLKYVWEPEGQEFWEAYYSQLVRPVDSDTSKYRILFYMGNDPLAGTQAVDTTRYEMDGFNVVKRTTTYPNQPNMFFELGSRKNSSEMDVFPSPLIQSLSEARASVSSTRFRFFGDFACGCEFEKETNIGGECIYINECTKNMSTCGPHSSCVDGGIGYDCKCDRGYSYDAQTGRSIRIRSDVDDTNREINSCQKDDYQILLRPDGFTIRIGYPIFNFSVEYGETTFGARPRQYFVVKGNQTTDLYFDSLAPPAMGKEMALKVVNTQTNETSIDTRFRVPCGCRISNLPYDEPVPRADDGRPISATVVQKLGLIYASWQDDSLCATTFSFLRVSLSDEQHRDLLLASTSSLEAMSARVESLVSANQARSAALVTDFQLDGSNCGAQYPALNNFDDIAHSNLVVGTAHYYCMTASNKNLGYFSSYACASPLVVQWEARIKINIKAGKFISFRPADNVNVHWTARLRGNPEDSAEQVAAQGVAVASGMVKSDGQGVASVQIVADPVMFPKLREQPELLLVLRFSKIDVLGNSTNDEIAHEFNCHSPLRPCTEADPLLVWVPHLSFDEISQEVRDVTTVDVTGTVTLDGTEDSFKNPQGCPLAEAKVCIRSLGGEIEFGCDSTNPFGEYRIPVTMGTKATVSVEYNGHYFERNDTLPRILTVDRLPISGVNFKDVRKEVMFVDLAGGACNSSFATSFRLQLVRDFCNSDIFVDSLSSIDGVRFRIPNIPAAKFTFKLVSVQAQGASAGENEKILEYLSSAGINNPPPTLDLTNPDNSSSMPNTTASQGVDLSSMPATNEMDYQAHRLVRFQYNPVPQLDLIFTSVDPNEIPSNVTMCSVDKQLVRTRSLSGHIEHQAIVRLMMVFPNHATCKYIPSAQVRFMNNLGLSQESSTRPLASNCLKGCIVDVEHFGSANDSRTLTNATATIRFIPMPTRVGDYSKSFSVELIDESILHPPRIDERIFVLGQVEDQYAGTQTFPLVEFDPIVILRDPPGGLSYAFAENMETTTTFQISSLANGGGGTLQASLSQLVEVDTFNCIGFGYMACINGFDMQVDSTLVETETNIKGMVKTMKRREISYTWKWTMETSATATSYPGKLNDMFLLPSLIVHFATVQEVYRTSGQCAASIRDTVVFDISPSGGAQFGVSWVSRGEIMNVILPDLRKTNVTANQTLSGLDRVRRSIVNLERILTLDAEAMQAKGKPIADSEAPEGLKSSERFKIIPGPADEPSPLLMRQELSNDFAQGPAAGNEALQTKKGIYEGSLISFGGNGARIGFESLIDMEDESLSGWSFEQDFRIGLGGSFAIGLGTLLRINVHGSGGNNHEEDHESGARDHQTARVGFFLGDQNPNDILDLKVTRDQRYGTYAFKVTGGQTLCPYEPGTYKREQPQIRVVKSPSGPVHPDEPAVFELQLINNGFEAFNYLVYSRPELWQDDLKLEIDGMDLGLVREFQKIPAEGVPYTAIVKVHRGTRKFSYRNLIIGLRSVCDSVTYISSGTLTYDDPVITRFEVELAAEFLEPCPKIALGGSFGREGSTSILAIIPPLLPQDGPKPQGVRLVARNLDENGRSWAEIDHVEEVLFQFKEGPHSEDWLTVKYPNGTAVNLAKLEDSSHFAVFDWSLAQEVFPLKDTVVAVRAIVKCNSHSAVAAVDPDLSLSASETGMIRLDRAPPQVFVGPKLLPFPGLDDLVVTFNEDIRCGPPLIILAALQVEGLAMNFDQDNNLLIRCEQNKIYVTTTVPRAMLLGRQALLTLRNVRDVAGNLAQSNVLADIPPPGQLEFWFQYATLEESSAILEIRGLVIPRISNNSLTIQNDIVAVFAAAIEIDPSRVQLSRFKFTENGVCVGDFEILPPIVPGSVDAAGGRRILQGTGSTSSSEDLLETFHQLVLNGNNGFILINGGFADFRPPSISAAPECFDNETSVDLGTNFQLVRTSVANLGNRLDSLQLENVELKQMIVDLKQDNSDLKRMIRDLTNSTTLGLGSANGATSSPQLQEMITTATASATTTAVGAAIGVCVGLFALGAAIAVLISRRHNSYSMNQSRTHKAALRRTGDFAVTGEPGDANLNVSAYNEMFSPHPVFHKVDV